MILRPYLIVAVLFCPIAWAAPNASEYVHLKVRPTVFTDFMPRKDSGSILPPPVAIGRTKFFVDLDFYFVPDGDESPSFINVKFNARRVDHEFVEIAAGIRQAHLWSAAEFKLWNDVSWAHEAQLRAQKLNQSMPREPEFADDAILASAFEKSNLEPGSATREFPQMMEDIHLALSPALFANPSLNLPVQFRITYERLDWQNPGQTVRYRRFFEGETELKSLTPDELTRLTSLIQLSKCQSMLGPRGS